MGQLEVAFSSHLAELLLAEPWGAVAAAGPERRAYFGGDRLREWVQPDFWAVLEGLDASPTVLAEIDTAPEGLEHNVAKYLWFVDRAGPFWNTPAILVSAFAMRAPRDYMLHQNIAVFLGRLLSEQVPGTAHALVDLRGDPDSERAGERLAKLAFEEVRRWAGDL